MPGYICITKINVLCSLPWIWNSNFSCPIIPRPITIVSIKYIRLSFFTKEIKRFVFLAI